MLSHGDVAGRHDVVAIGAERVITATGVEYGYKLAGADALARLPPDVPRAMCLPSQAHRI